MISLVVNSKCNQKCEYCFAYDTLHDNNTVMSLQTCSDILNFCNKSHVNIGIIGGEPTLHSQFDEILLLTNEYSLKNNFARTMLFTNGTNLCKYEDIILQTNISGLINVNHPDIVGINNYNNTCESIKTFNSMFDIGINIYPSLLDYDFIFDIIDNYKINYLRVSIACPDGKFKDMQKNRQEYFSKCINVFIDFCKKIIEHDVYIYMDCCAIPICYFTDKQKNIIKHVCTNYPNIKECGTLCTPNIEIHPDYSITTCFIKQESIYMNNFDNPYILQDYIYNNWINNLYNNMNYDKCSNCNLFNFQQCQGGCLRFSKSISCK